MVAEPLSISVIIPTYRRRESVRRALAALDAQTLPPERFEVLVAIDGSEDGTRELVEQCAAPYRLRGLWQPNRGRAAACNMGLAAARGELIVIMDDDMEPAPGFLAAHSAAHASGARLAVLGAVPVAFDQARPVTGLIAAKNSPLQARLAQRGRTIHFREFYIGNSSIRAAEIAAVGGFDDAFQIYGNEDSELALRLLRAGVRIAFCAEALAYQHYTKDFAGLARDNIAKGKTAVLLASKAPETFGDLRLSTYHMGALKWRLLRTGMLLASRAGPALPQLVIRTIEWLERRRPARLHLYYDLALDYFFWLGALPALRANRSAGTGLMRLRRPAGDA
jgi:GT2 family glycosyltransferase